MTRNDWNRTDGARRLGIEFPIIQGPFGGGLSSTALLAAVSNAGGLGSFGAHGLGARQIRELAAEIRTLTNRPFNLNLWVSDHDSNGHRISREEFDRNLARHRPYLRMLGLPDFEYPERFGHRFDDQVGAVLEVRPPVFSFIFGVPPKEVLDECRRSGIVTVGTATTVDEGVMLEDAGLDLIVATGLEAGGHRPSFLKPAEDSLTGSIALIPRMVDRVKVPVIAAGGIADARGMAAAFALGASAVQIGTAFLACDESGATDLHRDALRGPGARETVLTRAFSGRLARGLRNRFVDDMRPFESELPPYPSQNWFTARFRAEAMKQGRSDLVSLWSGQAVTLVKHHRAADLMQSLIDGMGCR